jgi:hypothetical protein
MTEALEWLPDDGVAPTRLDRSGSASTSEP